MSLRYGRYFVSLPRPLPPELRAALGEEDYAIDEEKGLAERREDDDCDGDPATHWEWAELFAHAYYVGVDSLRPDMSLDVQRDASVYRARGLLEVIANGLPAREGERLGRALVELVGDRERPGHVRLHAREALEPLGASANRDADGLLLLALADPTEDAWLREEAHLLLARRYPASLCSLPGEGSPHAASDPSGRGAVHGLVRPARERRARPALLRQPHGGRDLPRRLARTSPGARARRDARMRGGRAPAARRRPAPRAREDDRRRSREVRGARARAPGLDRPGPRGAFLPRGGGVEGREILGRS
ncbi:hypothetical protein HY251_00565 [bacterium]|nr:hypothetical protein [bacterium]